MNERTTAELPVVGEVIGHLEFDETMAYMKSVEKAGLVSSMKAKGFKVTLTAEA